MTQTSQAGGVEPNPLPLDWTYQTEHISAGGLQVQRDATDAERAAVAAALGALDCPSLRASYRITRAPDDGYRLKGRLTADVVQACVVTLAPVLETVTADLLVEFRPAQEVAALPHGHVELESESEIEPIEGTTLNVGRVIFEELVAGLNPYPRRPGAEFVAPAAPETNATSADENPFAVLAKLKDPKSTG